jgi:MtN3 and saliva related transmembrane protein
MKTELIGLIAGILTACSLLPQLIKTLKEHKAEGVSVFIFIILMCGTGMWVYYGVLRDDLPLIVTNAFSFALNVLMLILKIRYSK